MGITDRHHIPHRYGLEATIKGQPEFSARGKFEIAQGQFQATVLGMVIVSDGESNVDGIAGQEAAFAAGARPCSSPRTSKVILVRKSVLSSRVLGSQFSVDRLALRQRRPFFRYAGLRRRRDAARGR